MSAADIVLYLSGGAANSDPDLSLGGTKSSISIDSQSTTALSNVTGVVIEDALGNTVGAGTLYFTFTGSYLSWKDAGDPSAGTAINVSVDDTYLIPNWSVDGFLRVTTTSASFAGSDQNDAVTVTDIANNLFDDIPSSDSEVGEDDYRCIYIKNDSASIDMEITAYFQSLSSGADAVSMAFDLAGVDGLADTIVNDETAPDPALTFVNPTTSENGITVTLAFGAQIAIWFKRTIPAFTLDSNDAAKFVLRLDAVQV